MKPLKITQLFGGYYVETWYNRSEQSWVTQHKDCEGNQLGDADYCGNKDSAMKLHEWLVVQLLPRGVISYQGRTVRLRGKRKTAIVLRELKAASHHRVYLDRPLNKLRGWAVRDIEVVE